MFLLTHFWLIVASTIISIIVLGETFLRRGRVWLTHLRFVGRSGWCRQGKSLILPHAPHTDLYNNPPHNHRLPTHLPSLPPRVRLFSKRRHLRTTDPTTNPHRSSVPLLPSPRVGAVVHVCDDNFLCRRFQRRGRSYRDRKAHRSRRVRVWDR